jgi:hypothetical protein
MKAIHGLHVLRRGIRAYNERARPAFGWLAVFQTAGNAAHHRMHFCSLVLNVDERNSRGRR